MPFFVPKEFTPNLDRIAPDTEGVKEEASSMFGSEGSAEQRASTIYQIMSMLVADERLNEANLKGDVCCLDVGSLPTEAAVFKRLRANSITIAEGKQRLPASLKQKTPEIRQIIADPIEALSQITPASLNLITMFNAFSESVETEQTRAELIKAIARVLKVGGNYVLTCDSIHWEDLKRLEKEIARGKASPELKLTFPTSDREPMYGRGWVMRSILVENTLGFDYDKAGIEPGDNTHDAFILVAEKIND